MLPSPFRIAATRTRKRPAAEAGPANGSAQACTGLAAPAGSAAGDMQPAACSDACKHLPRAAQQQPAFRCPLLPVPAVQNPEAMPSAPRSSPTHRAAPMQHAADSAQRARQQASTFNDGSTPRAARRRALVLSSPDSPHTDRGQALVGGSPARFGGAANDAQPPRMSRDGTLNAFLQRIESDALPQRELEAEEAASEPTKLWKRPRTTVWYVHSASVVRSCLRLLHKRPCAGPQRLRQSNCFCPLGLSHALQPMH